MQPGRRRHGPGAGGTAAALAALAALAQHALQARFSRFADRDGRESRESRETLRLSLTLLAAVLGESDAEIDWPVEGLLPADWELGGTTHG